MDEKKYVEMSAHADVNIVELFQQIARQAEKKEEETEAPEG